MKRASFVVAVAAALLAAAPALAWSFGVHAYVADRIGKRNGAPNLNEVYGATLPDLFNFAFALPPGLFDPTCDRDTLYAFTHETSYLDVIQRKNRGLEKWLAVGFHSHNPFTGADGTAHFDAALTGPPGYVVAKAFELQYLLEAGIPGMPPPLADVLPGISQPAQHLLYHAVVEYGVDLLLKEQAPEIGLLLMAGASFWPDGSFPPILTDAFADDVAACFDGDEVTAAAYISLVETAHRLGVWDEGYILTLPAGEARQVTAARLAILGILYLGYSPDPEDPNYMDPGPLTQLADAYLQVVPLICGDALEEIEATVGLVEERLRGEGVLK